MDIVHPLKIWRKANGLSTIEVGRRLGCTRQTVCRYEAGTRIPERSVLDRIIIMTGGSVTANDWVGTQASQVLSGQSADKEAADASSANAD
ncbi:helix-turn-helix domain-containing protein [Pseudaminobacter salicylatoxidans]|uniref:helix-turn-helix transcriptional regulator n=1 Tax=Pseudaminobacter salicylatoxidans TaxID=93369 RepID=UPI000D6D33F2